MRIGSWVKRAHLHVNDVSKAIVLKDLSQRNPVLSARGSEGNRHGLHLDFLSIESSSGGQHTNENNTHHRSKRQKCTTIGTLAMVACLT